MPATRTPRSPSPPSNSTKSCPTTALPINSESTMVTTLTTSAIASKPKLSRSFPKTSPSTNIADLQDADSLRGWLDEWVLHHLQRTVTIENSLKNQPKFGCDRNFPSCHRMSSRLISFCWRNLAPVMSLHWDFLPIERVILRHVLYGRRMLRDDDLLGDRAPVHNQPQFVLDWRGDGWADRLFQNLVDELHLQIRQLLLGSLKAFTFLVGCLVSAPDMVQICPYL